MKIALVTYGLITKGGTERQFLELASALEKAGNEVDVFCYEYDQEKCYKDLCEPLNIYSVTSHEIKIENKVLSHLPAILKNSIRTLVRTISIPSDIKKLSLLITSKNPYSSYDVINLHDHEVYKLSRCTSYNKFVWMSNDIQDMTRKETVFHRVYNLLRGWLMRFEIKNIKTITVLDERNRLMVKNYLNREARIVRSGIDLDIFKNYPITRLDKPEKFTIFASSIFYSNRRYEDLVEAVTLLLKRGVSNFSVVINGRVMEEDYFKSILEKIEKNDLSSYIKIINGMSEDMLRKHYTSADIFVFLNYKQTWGLSVFEAMLGGCASVVSKGCGASDILTDMENALLVDPNNPEQVADAIQKIINDNDFRIAISRKSRQFVIDNLSWDKYAHSMLKIFKEVA